MNILILGIGNTLLSDEGVGVHVLHTLAAGGDLPESVELLDGGTLSFTLAVPIQNADALIVVDAAQLGSLPGTWQRFMGEAMDDFLLGKRNSSVHEVGLTDLRAIAILADHWPAQRALFAIQPQYMDWGEQPTPAVAACVPAVAAAIRILVDQWLHDSQQK